MSIYESLNDAIYEQKKIAIKTKERIIIGVPHSFDEFDTDDTRLACSILINELTVETVHLDDIESIEKAVTFGKPVFRDFEFEKQLEESIREAENTERGTKE